MKGISEKIMLYKPLRTRKGNDMKILTLSEDEARHLKRLFVRRKDGAKVYDMDPKTFDKLGAEAGAIVKYDGVKLFDIARINEYLETFREPPTH